MIYTNNMTTKDPSFSFAVAPLGNRVITHEQILIMVDYRSNLVDVLIYEPMARGILEELRRVDSWINKRSMNFILDNNRKLTA
jgi:hypothetical protein